MHDLAEPVALGRQLDDVGARAAERVGAAPVLIGGGYGISEFIDFKNLDTSFLFNIGAGAGAMILKRDWPENRVLGNHMICDGSMSRHVIIPASGTVQHPTDQAVADGEADEGAARERVGEVLVHLTKNICSPPMGRNAEVPPSRVCLE